MENNFHLIELVLNVPEGLIEKDSVPFSYKPLRTYLKSFGWRDVFHTATRYVGLTIEKIDREILRDKIGSSGFIMGEG